MDRRDKPGDDDFELFERATRDSHALSPCPASVAPGRKPGAK